MAYASEQPQTGGYDEASSVVVIPTQWSSLSWPPRGCLVHWVALLGGEPKV